MTPDTIDFNSLSKKQLVELVITKYNDCFRLEEENKKLHDEFMLRLAEAFLLPPTSNQMAVYKQWNFYKWYDEVKNQMRKEIKE